MLTPAQSTSRQPRDRNVAGRLMALVGYGCCVGASLAQTNQTRVGNAITSACSLGASSSVCFLADDHERSQFAPDKFVMQSVVAVGAVRQQMSLVDGRLDELRSARSSFGRPGFSGTRGLSGASTTTSSERHQASAAPAAGTQLAPRLGRELLLASTSATLPDILAALSQESESATPSGSASFPSTDIGVYLRVEADEGDADPTAFDPGFRSRTTGLTAGADYKVSTNVVLGGALSYSDDKSTLDTSDDTPGGNLKTRSAGVSLYGAYYPSAAAYVDATLVFGRNRYESIRDNNFTGDSAIGSADGKQYGVSLGAGYSFLSSNFSFGPYARVSSSKAEVDAFTEQTSASDTQLAVQAQSAESLVSVLGAQISYAVSKSWGVLVPNARLEWEHQYKDDRTRNIRANFASADWVLPTPIDIETTPPDRDYFNLGLGLASHFGVGRSAFVYYETVLGKDGTKNHAVTAELRLEF